MNPNLLKIMMEVGQLKGENKMYKSKFFGIKELVSKVVYDYYTKLYGVSGGEALMWSFFDALFLQDLDTIRANWGRPITINNWHLGGQYEESGLRCNVDSLVKGKTTPYCGGHNFAKAGDLKDSKGENSKLHDFVCGLINQGKLKVIRRIENIKNTPTWTHCDSFQTPNDKLLIF